MHYSGSPTDLLNPPPYAIQERRPSHKRRPCPICTITYNPSSSSSSSSSNNNNNSIHQQRQQQNKRRSPFFPVMPYLIHQNRPHHIRTCPCPQKVHLTCLTHYKQKEIDCQICGHVYKTRLRLFTCRLVCLMAHLLSMASVVGLIFGLAQLGSALDKLGLGNEAGSKLDGDETWQDHELQEIMEWLQLVHYATGAAGEALLGLVYIVGVCGVIGLERTVQVLNDIIHVNLESLLYKEDNNNTNTTTMPEWLRKTLICTCLTLIGLTLGTYLLFYSWIWACLLQHVCSRILNLKPLSLSSNNNSSSSNSSKV